MHRVAGPVAGCVAGEDGRRTTSIACEAHSMDGAGLVAAAHGGCDRLAASRGAERRCGVGRTSAGALATASHGRRRTCEHRVGRGKWRARKRGGRAQTAKPRCTADDAGQFASRRECDRPRPAERTTTCSRHFATRWPFGDSSRQRLTATPGVGFEPWPRCRTPRT